MNASILQSRTIGKIAVATSVIGVSTFIFGFIFTFARNILPVFYGLNNLFNLIMALMSGVLAWMMYSRFREHVKMLHGWLFILVAVGMILALNGFLKIVFSYTGWILSG